MIAGLSIIGGILFARFIFWRKNDFKKPSYKYTDNLAGNKVDMKKQISNINNNPKQVQQLEKLDSVCDQHISTKNNSILEDEIKLYQFEKDLVTRAIENILVASRNNSIDNLERDRLMIKYKEQLGSLNQNMERIQSQIDITKLINFRDDLMNILENKISQIDEKITDINYKYRNFIGIDLPNKNNSINFDIKSNNSQDQDTIKNRINKMFNKNPESKFTKKLLDIKIDKKREIIDYKLDHPIKEEGIEEEEKVQKLSKKVLVALENLEKTKPLEDSINDKIESINRYGDEENIQKEKPKSNVGIKKEGMPIISIFNKDTNLNKNKVVQDIQQKDSEYLELKGQDKKINKSWNRFPLASFFSSKENQNKIKQENERKVKNMITREEEEEEKLEQNRNPLGNIFKNIRY